MSETQDTRLDRPARRKRPRATTSAEDAAARYAVRRALRLALWIWPAFGVLDVYMVLTGFPGASPALIALYRLAMELLLLAGYYVAGRRDVPSVWLERLVPALFFTAGVFVCLMSIDFDGLVSPYMHGLSVIVLVQVALFPLRLRSALARSLPIAAAFPVVHAIDAVFEPSRAAQWYDGHTLAVFGSHYVLVISIVIVGSVASHVAWSARQQVYRARRLGRYRVEAQIGRGGMGEVWLAWDDVLKRNVALKVLRSEASRSSAWIARFENEARVASNLRSPHTIKIFDFGADDDGLRYIAMEYLPGSDLAEVVKRQGVFDAARATQLALDVCESLIEAHAAGVIHRDIKPQNLFLTTVGGKEAVKVLDFGIARFDSSPVTELVAGTPGYIAPEVAQGGTADARSDVYALGATLLFLVTGRAPTPENLPEHAPPALVPIIRRCMAPDVRERFQTIRSLRDALSAR